MNFDVEITSGPTELDLIIAVSSGHNTRSFSVCRNTKAFELTSVDIEGVSQKFFGPGGFYRFIWGQSNSHPNIIEVADRLTQFCAWYNPTKGTGIMAVSSEHLIPDLYRMPDELGTLMEKFSTA